MYIHIYIRQCFYPRFRVCLEFRSRLIRDGARVEGKLKSWNSSLILDYLTNVRFDWVKLARMGLLGHGGVGAGLQVYYF